MGRLGPLWFAYYDQPTWLLLGIIVIELAGILTLLAVLVFR